MADGHEIDDRVTFAACLAHLLDLDAREVPVPAMPDPFVGWRGWLATRGLGLIPIAGAARFSWPGFWLAHVTAPGPARWVVMFGVPSGPVFDPVDATGAEALAISAGFAVAPLELAAARWPAATASGVGRVEGIYVAHGAEARMESRRDARATTAGLDGDRYAAGAGTFSDPHATGLALTLIEAEALAAVRLPDGSPLPHAEARRNLVTRGIVLNDLVGRSFSVGDVECFGQRLCEPCALWQRLTRPGVLRGFVHRGGLRADIVTPGVLRLGDTITAAG
jgi:hypothetical protein